MKLTDAEKAMRDGHEGAAVARAMDLLIRYGEALGAERLVETRNVCGTVTASTPFMRDFALKYGGLDAVYSEFNLDSAEVVPVPKVRAFSSHLQLGFDPHHPAEMGVGEEVVQFYRRSEAMVSKMGVQMMNTCTPYQVGNMPTRGEHCAWMESSAVVYCQFGAGCAHQHRRAREHQRRDADLPHPRLGLPPRRAAARDHRHRTSTPVDTVEDWGLLGYWMGEWVQERVPAVRAAHDAAQCRTCRA